MKRVIILLSVVLVGSGMFAQKANVSKAKNKALATENPDFAGARLAIQLALNDETTKNDPNTWYVAGLIGYKENEYLFLQSQMGKKPDDVVKGEAIIESYNYFLTADELGLIPNAKGKIDAKIRKNIVPKMAEYYQRQDLIIYGIYLNEQKDYKKAYDVFTLHLAIPDLDMFQGTKEQEKMPRDTTYYQYQYYRAMFASQSGMKQEAIAIYEDLKDKLYEQKLVYQLLYQEYHEQQDTVKFVGVLKEAIDKFPAEPWFLQNLLNFYLNSNQIEASLRYLDQAIEREPHVAQYHHIKGNIEANNENWIVATADYNRALELDPKLADAYAGLGRIHYNQAIKLLEKASDIKDNNVYKAKLEEANEIFKKSLPWFKKANELNPEEREYKMILKTLYYRLEMQAEYDAIVNEL